GKFDNGEPGVANVRVMTSTGQTATTDRYGQYNLPALAAGSVLVAVDPATLPYGLELPAGESRSGGASRLLRTPLDGGAMLRQNFPLIRTARATVSPKAPVIERPQGDTWGEAAKLEIAPERLIMSAGGRDKQILRVMAKDKDGNPASKTSIVLTTPTGALIPLSKASDRDP